MKALIPIVAGAAAAALVLGLAPTAEAGGIVYWGTSARVITTGTPVVTVSPAVTPSEQQAYVAGYQHGFRDGVEAERQQAVVTSTYAQSTVTVPTYVPTYAAPTIVVPTYSVPTVVVPTYTVPTYYTVRTYTVPTVVVRRTYSTYGVCRPTYRSPPPVFSHRGGHHPGVRTSGLTVRFGR